MQHRINRSAVVAVLEQWEGQWPPGARQDVAQRLAGALGALDALRLDSALRAMESPPATATAGATGVDTSRLRACFESAVQEMQALLAPPQDAAPAPQRLHGRIPAPVHSAQAPAQAPVFAVQHQRYQLLQQQLAHKVAQLRAQLRQWLRAGPAPLQQLAALDAAMEQLMAEREHKHWAGLGRFLERRWGYQMERHAALPELGQRAFAQDMQTLLGAEIEVRLLPARGLVEAANQHTSEG